MRTVTILLEIEDEQFDAMEKVLLENGCENIKENSTDEEWELFVIKRYKETETYLDIHNNDLEKAYIDMLYDF